MGVTVRTSSPRTNLLKLSGCNPSTSLLFLMLDRISIASKLGNGNWIRTPSIVSSLFNLFISSINFSLLMLLSNCTFLNKIPSSLHFLVTN